MIHSITWLTGQRRCLTALKLKRLLLLWCIVVVACSSFGAFSCSFSPRPYGTPCCWRGGSVTASIQFLVGPQPLNEVVFGAGDWQAAQLQLGLQFRDLTEDGVKEKLRLTEKSEETRMNIRGKLKRIKGKRREKTKRQSNPSQSFPLSALSWQATLRLQNFVNRESFTYVNFYPPLTSSTVDSRESCRVLNVL